MKLPWETGSLGSLSAKDPMLMWTRSLEGGKVHLVTQAK